MASLQKPALLSRHFRNDMSQPHPQFQKRCYDFISNYTIQKDYSTGPWSNFWNQTDVSLNSSPLSVWWLGKSILIFANSLPSSKIPRPFTCQGFCEDPIAPVPNMVCIQWLQIGTHWMTFSPWPNHCVDWKTSGSILYFFHSPQQGLITSILTLCTQSCGQSLSMACKMQYDLTPHSGLISLHEPCMTPHSWDISIFSSTHALYSQNAFSQLQLPSIPLSCGSSPQMQKLCYLPTPPLRESILPPILHWKPTGDTLYHSTYKVIQLLII